MARIYADAFFTQAAAAGAGTRRLPHRLGFSLVGSAKVWGVKIWGVKIWSVKIWGVKIWGVKILKEKTWRIKIFAVGKTCLWGLCCLSFFILALPQATKAQDANLSALASELDALAKAQGVRVLSAPETLALDSLVEKALAISDKSEAWQAPARRRAVALLYGLSTETLRRGDDLRSEQLLLRARAILPEDEESLREDAKTRAQIFVAFGKLHLQRHDWQQARFWLAQAARHVQEAGEQEAVVPHPLAYEIAYNQALVRLRQAEALEKNLTPETTAQGLAQAREALVAFRALYEKEKDEKEIDAKEIDSKETAVGEMETLFAVAQARQVLEVRDATAQAAALLARLQEQAGEESRQAAQQAQSLWNQTLQQAADGTEVPPNLHASALEGLARIALTRGQLHDALAAAEYALTLRRGAGQVQAESFVLRGQLRFASRAFGEAAEDFKHAERLLLTRRRGATLASAEQAYSAALARLRAAESAESDASAVKQAGEAASHAVAVSETLLQSGLGGLGLGQSGRREILPSPSLLTRPLTQADLHRLRILVVQSRTLLGVSQIGQGLETLALATLEQAWYAGETHASCGRVLAAYEAAAEQALLLAHRGAGHQARQRATEARNLLVCHQGSESPAVRALDRRLAKILR